MRKYHSVSLLPHIPQTQSVSTSKVDPFCVQRQHSCSSSSGSLLFTGKSRYLNRSPSYFRQQQEKQQSYKTEALIKSNILSSFQKQSQEGDIKKLRRIADKQFVIEQNRQSMKPKTNPRLLENRKSQ